MKDTAASTSYRKAIVNSFELTTVAISELKKGLNNEFKDLNYESLNRLQKDLIFDTAKLIKSKNVFKNEVNNSNLQNMSKIKSNDSCVENSFLLKYEIQNFKNNENWNLLNKMLNTLPDLKINDILSIIDNENDNINANDDVDMDNDVNMNDDQENVTELIKTLDIPVNSIKELIWNNETNEINDFKRDEFSINDTVNEKINSILSNSDIKKFRLVQLHDKYYQRKISLLKESDMKWNSELNKIKNFISNDINKFKADLNSKLEIEQKEEDALNAKLRDSVGILDYEEDIDDVDDMAIGDHEDEEEDEEEDAEDDEDNNDDDAYNEEVDEIEESVEPEESQGSETPEPPAEASTETQQQQQTHEPADHHQQDPAVEDAEDAEIEE